MDANIIATFFLLVGLEIVLGIDNILLISILTDRLPPENKNFARLLGLGLAFGARLLLLLGASILVKLDEPIALGYSWKSLILIGGGGFLLFKATKEIHHLVENRDEHLNLDRVKPTLASVIAQIILLDLVFSIDSVITAVGLTENLIVIYASVIVSFVFVMAFSGGIAAFVQKHAALKILALSFLVTIGVTLVIEGLGGHVPKGYIYLPMGFSLAVELLQMRFSANLSKIKKSK